MSDDLPTVDEALAELRGALVWFSLDHGDHDEPLLRVRVPRDAFDRVVASGRWTALPDPYPGDARFASIGPPWRALARRIRAG